MTTLYDPLTYDNLMAGLALHFQQRARRSLATAAEDVEIQGPGIYALFYSGNFDAYAVIAGGARPIYVGKAVPPGSRKGSGVDASQPALRRRLREHAKSIDVTENLRVADFTCKHLAVVPVWVTLAERFLIEHYKPVWNLSLDGFGDHDPGRGRRNSQRSWWDTLHPGRGWAARLAGRDGKEAEAKVVAFLDEDPHLGKRVEGSV